MLALYSEVRNWLRGEEGQDLADHALFIGLIALVGVITVSTVLGGELAAAFTAISDGFAAASLP